MRYPLNVESNVDAIRQIREITEEDAKIFRDIFQLVNDAYNFGRSGTKIDFLRESIAQAKRVGPIPPDLMECVAAFICWRNNAYKQGLRESAAQQKGARL